VHPATGKPKKKNIDPIDLPNPNEPPSQTVSRSNPVCTKETAAQYGQTNEQMNKQMKKQMNKQTNKLTN
jgi:hypothetical protein